MRLSAYAFKKGTRRNAIAIDPSFIKKSGKCTPYMGSFCSGCAGAVKRGFKILGIGVVNVDLHECMMLKAVQTTLDKDKENNDMSLYDRYVKVLSNNKQILQRITSVLVADSAFSKKPFIDNMLGIGFNVISRLRHDAALYYLWDGEPTGKSGRPRVKGEKIDFKNIDKSKVAILNTDKSNEQVYALKAWCKSLHRKISLVIHILPKGGHRLYFSTDV